VKVDRRTALCSPLLGLLKTKEPVRLLWLTGTDDGYTRHMSDGRVVRVRFEGEMLEARREFLARMEREAADVV
jgi:hypothetical protein